MPTSHAQPAAPRAAAHRSKPRHRARHREALLGRGLARDHLLAPSLSRRTARGRWGRRTTSRSTSPIPKARSRRSPRSSSGWRTASCMRWSTMRRSRPRPTAASGCPRSTPRSTSGEHVFRVNFFAPIMLARGLVEELKAAQGLGGQRHLDRRLARASVRGRGLRHLEGGARLAHARDGGRFRPARHPRQRDRAGRDRHRDPLARHRGDRGASRSRCTASARPTRSPRSSTCCAPRRRPT